MARMFSLIVTSAVLFSTVAFRVDRKTVDATSSEVARQNVFNVPEESGGADAPEKSEPDAFQWLEPEDQKCSKGCADGNGPGHYEKERLCQKRKGETGPWETVSVEECIDIGKLPKPDGRCNKKACRAAWSTKKPPEPQEVDDTESDDPPAAPSPAWKPEVSDDDWGPCDVPCVESRTGSFLQRIGSTSRNGSAASNHKPGSPRPQIPELARDEESIDFEDEWIDVEPSEPMQKRVIMCVIEDGPGNWKEVKHSHCLNLIKHSHVKLLEHTRPCKPAPPLCSETTTTTTTTTLPYWETEDSS